MICISDQAMLSELQGLFRTLMGAWGIPVSSTRFLDLKRHQILFLVCQGTQTGKQLQDVWISSDGQLGDVKLPFSQDAWNVFLSRERSYDFPSFPFGGRFLIVSWWHAP